RQEGTKEEKSGFSRSCASGAHASVASGIRELPAYPADSEQAVRNRASSGAQSEAPQTRVQSAAAQSQRGGGSGLDALGLPQRIDNGALFDLCERRRRAQRTVGGVARHGGPQRAHGEAKMGGRNVRSLGEDERALDRVLQLAHVARPVVSEQDVARLAGQGCDGPSHPCGGGPQKMVGQEEHVLIPLPQRRKMQAEDGQAIVEI